METIEESEDKQDKAGIDSGLSTPAEKDGANAAGDNRDNGATEASTVEQQASPQGTPMPSAMPEVTAKESAAPLATNGTPAETQPPTSKPKRQRSALPVVLPGADLSQPGTKRLWVVLSVAIALVVSFAIYVSYIPNFMLYGNPPTGDQPYYLMDVISMAHDGDLNVKNNYDDKDYDTFYNYKPEGFVGMSAPYPPGRQLADSSARPESEEYSAHPPGLPLVLLPGWIIGEQFGVGLGWPGTLVVMCLLASLLSVNIFLLAHEMTGKLWIAWAVWLPLAFSGPILTFSYIIFTEMPTGLLMVYAFRRLALGWRANGPIRLLLVGACIGFIPWLSLRCAPIAVLLGLYAVVQWWRFARIGSQESGVRSQESVIESQEAESDSQAPTAGSRWGRFVRDARRYAKRRNLVSAAWIVAPVLLSALLLVGFNFYKSGSFFPSSSEKGRVDHFFWPWAGMDDLIKFINAALGTFFDSRFGLLFYTPIYLLVIVGLIAMFRTRRSSDRRLLLWMAILTLPYMFLITAYEGWHGVWCPPGRYLATFVPLAAAPLGMSLFVLTRNWITGIIYGVIYVAMSVVGLITANAMIIDARVMWPLSYSPTYEWLAQEKVAYGFLTGLQQSPLKTLQFFSLYAKFDVQPYFANFVKPDEVFHPINSGRFLLAATLIVFFCALMLFIPGMMREGKRWSLPVHGLTWLGVFAVVGLGWYVINDQYLKHKTTLTIEKVWTLAPPPEEPYGIAYRNGKVYFTSFARDGVGYVATLDTESGDVERIVPKLNGKPTTFAHPTDVKFSSDGLMYVLNNGDGDDALWALNKDGEVVRRVALNGKTPIATGLYVGQNGSFYVADMLGGRINMWGNGGGNTIASWGGPKGGYNNPSGVAVTDDSNVYAMESGNQLVHEITPNGEYVRTYDPQCRPVHAIAKGDWVDVSCDAGMVSINTKDNHLQFTSFEPPTKPESMRGLAYGEDDNLYILDSNTNRILEYKIQH